jgi:uncharacterized protein (DUF1499 family)
LRQPVAACEQSPSLVFFEAETDMVRHLIKSSTIVVLVGGLLGACASTTPRTSTQTGSSSMLTPCPNAPHCVSSQADTTSARHVEPLLFKGTAAQAHDLLLQALRQSSNATIESDTPTAVHATFRSLLGFVDDVYFELAADSGRIDVKSISRLGYYDFGVNRRRVEELRSRFESLQKGA